MEIILTCHRLSVWITIGFEALDPTETVGSVGGRNFVLCKKQIHPQMTEARSEMISRKRSGSWKAWLNKSFSFKVLSH